MSFTATRAVEVDLRALERRCMMRDRTYKSEGQVLLDKGGLLIHQDNGAKVLGVAHLDYVGERRPMFTYHVDKQHNRHVVCDRLDDRLGAYMLLDLLPRLGVKCDVLLTDNEEMCQSTARDFTTSKQYNWIFSFDRRGTDVVMYQYDTQERANLLEEHGFTVGTGSYSDIACLDGLGVTGFNFGCGYYEQHTSRCNANLFEVQTQAEAFAKFWAAMKDTLLPHDPAAPRRKTKWSGGTWWQSSYGAAKGRTSCGNDKARKKHKRTKARREGYGAASIDPLEEYQLENESAYIREWEEEQRAWEDQQWARQDRITDQSDDEFAAADAAYWRAKERAEIPY